MAASVAISNGFGSLGGSIFLVYAIRRAGHVCRRGRYRVRRGKRRLAARCHARRTDLGTVGVGKTMVGAAFLSGPAALLFLSPQSSPIPFLITSFVLVGFAAVVFNVTGISFQQAVTPDRMLGRP